MYDGRSYQLVTADAQLGSGTVAVYGMHIISGASAGIVTLRNGTSTGGTQIMRETGTADTGYSVNFGGEGVVFPSGCFVDINADVTSVAVWYEKI
jgi:hypothetical protein